LSDRGNGNSAFDRQNVEGLHAELQRVTLVNMDDFPLDVERINSIVRAKAGKMVKLWISFL
jgi:hypothetical protein